MKRLTLIALLATLMLWPANMNAQSWLERMADRAVDRAKNKVDNKVDDAIDGAMDDAADQVSKKAKKKDKKNKQQDADEEEAEVQDEPQSYPAPKQKKVAKGETATYTQSDFVPGATPFFTDDVKGEQVGEFPSKWDFVAGEECQVATIHGSKAIRLGGWGSEIQPLMKNMDSYLPEEFTVEFEVWSHPTGGSSANNGLAVVFITEEGWDALKFEFSPDADPDGNSWLNYGMLTPNGDSRGGSNDKIGQYIQANTWTKVQVSFNKRAFKVYLNGNRVINLPNVKRPLRLKLGAATVAKDEDGLDRFFLRNFRFAKGAVALYDRNTTDADAVAKAIAETGQFVTNNILFETGKATLKPESMAEIQKVADLMKKNPSVRFEVQGHTDNQGSDKINDPLSEERAKAVVKALEDMGCDGFNLRAVGKGSHEPVADNKTEAGRAKNRRVVFVKK